MGNASLAASAPSSTAFTSEPCSRATASASNATSVREKARAAASSSPGGWMARPVAIFSWMEKSRWVEATIVVRSGEGNPSSMARPTSRNSGASRTSSAPGTG